MDVKLSEIDLFKVYSKWNNGLDGFKCFVRATNFVSLKHYPDFVLNQITEDVGHYFEIISNQIKRHSPADTIFILDITGTEAIKAAFLLREMFSIAPILVFNGVLHPFGLIGDRNYISNLIGYGMKIKEIDKKGHILVLDNDRYGEYSEEQLKENFNNQYELGEEDLPSVEMLTMHGYNKVVYMYGQNEKEDLLGYLEYLTQANIYIEKVSITV